MQRIYRTVNITRFAILFGCSLLSGLVVLIASIPAAEALPTGAPAGRSKIGCAGCHQPYSGTVISSLQMTVPVTVTALSTVLITASITGTTDAPGVHPVGGGLEVSASRGVLSAATGTKTILNAASGLQEVTHTSRERTEWTFVWQASSANGPVDIWGAFLLNNGDTKSSFDNWRVISSTITVVGGEWPLFLPVAPISHTLITPP